MANLQQQQEACDAGQESSPAIHPTNPSNQQEEEEDNYAPTTDERIDNLTRTMNQFKTLQDTVQNTLPRS
jgi:hypothetical protein